MMLKNPLIKKYAYFGLIPSIFFLSILAYPFVQGAYLTFTNWNGFGYTKVIGFPNYLHAVQDPVFWSTIWFTVKFVIGSVIAVNAVAFGLALLVTSKLKSSNVFRTFFFIPNLIGGIALGVIWQFIFNNILTGLSHKFALPFFKSSLLGTTGGAYWALILVTVWQSSGYMMIIYITGLVSIDNEVLEAAKVDGASALRTLWNIKMPLMVQAFTISLFLTLRNGFMAYDVNLSLTGGGPFRTTELVSMHVYNEAFSYGHFGSGQAKAVIMFIFVALAALLQVGVSKRLEANS